MMKLYRRPFVSPSVGRALEIAPCTRAELTLCFFVYICVIRKYTEMCKHSPDKFCFICGLYIFKESARKKLTTHVLVAYEQYFGLRAKNMEKTWTPNSVCTTCSARLNEFTKGSRSYLSFGKPFEWRNPIDHVSDCYFCLTKLRGGKYSKATYPDVSSVTKTAPHSTQYPKREPPTPKAESLSSQGITASISNASSSPSTSSQKAEPINQRALNDLCRDLNLSKEKSELLASRLQERGYLESGTNVTYYRNRNKNFEQYFSKTENFCYCNNVNKLFAALGETHDPNEWRLFIDGSKYSVKAVLLHKGNKKPSIPVAHSTNVKETYETMKELLQLIDYSSYNWKICCDLKVVALLTGLQGGYTKYSCFLCLWDSRADDKHFTQQVWPKRVEHVVGKNNVTKKALVEKKKVIFPPLHIKLGLMKNFVKALAKKPENTALKYLKTKFPRLSTEKIKAGIFVGPQIKKLFTDTEFQQYLDSSEAKAWKGFQKVVHGFLGNNRSNNDRQLIHTMMKYFKTIG